VESTDDEDEVLAAMAEQLGSGMLEHVGGPAFAHTLLQPLKRLATVEEASVRDPAVASMVSVAGHMSPMHVLEHWFPMVMELKGHDYFTARISACRLCGVALASLPPRERAEESAAFQRLCEDDTPMVRRVAAARLGAFAAEVAKLRGDDDMDDEGSGGAKGGDGAASSSSGGGGSPPETSPAAAARRLSPLLPLFTALAQDDQDSVRLQSVDNCVALAKLLTMRCDDNARAAAAAAAAAEATAMSDGAGAGTGSSSGGGGGDGGGSAPGPSNWVPPGPVTGAAAAAAAEAIERSRGGGGGGGVGGDIGADDALCVDAVVGGGAGDLQQRATVALGKVFQVVLQTCRDPSWRVRWSVVAKFDELVGAFGPSRKLSEAYEALLSDPEPEVRTAAATVVTKVSGFLDEAALLDVVLPSILNQADDQSEHVRAALASVANGLAPVLGRDHTIAHLLPLLLQLLRDANSEVRLNIIAQLGEINAVIGVDLLAQSLLPTILDLARDSKWRVRMAIIERMPMLAQQLGLGFFNERLCSQCIAWLHDDVYSIRAAAAQNLRALAALFGVEWCSSLVLPQLTAMARRVQLDEASGQQVLANPSLHRAMALLALQTLAPALNAELATQQVLPAVLELCRDPVPNIRFNAAKALETIAPLVEPRAVAGDIRPCLSTMVQDADRDVKYFAEKAMAVVSA
jgi:HEAT repeat protein